MVHDRPIDFGLQNFCAQCNKCARECPSGAITAGPKVMFNGYEIWRSDPEKCTRYRITNAAGGMCGRCMKTCPWNLEGLFSDSAFRWLAMHAPSSAGMLARLDDALDRGVINPVKTWWWDIELDKERTRYVEAAETNRRFPLDESATLSILMAGGIGVTPLIAMAHRLHALRRPFLFHYSTRTEERSGFASVLRAMPWAESVLFHFSREGGRAR